MGIARGRFVVDTHVHAQRHAFKFKERSIKPDYANQSRRDGPPAHQVDVFGWSLRQLDKLEIPQDDLNLILGGNAVRLFKLEDKVPHTRLFKQYLL